MERILLWLFPWVARRRLATLHRVGALLGWLSYLLSPTYRRRFRAHVAQAAIPWIKARPAVAGAGRMVAETPWLWLRPVGEPLGARVQWDGAQHVDTVLGTGRGLILLTPHLGCFEVTAQAYAERWGGAHPITVLFRPARKAWLRQLTAQSRDRPGLTAVPTTLAGVRQMMRALRAGGAVGLLPDQVPPDGLGVWAPFFGRPAYTMTLAARLAQTTGAAVVLTWGERLPGGAGWRVGYEPMPDRWLDGLDATAAAQHINAAMENLIRRHPGQYLWGYHRYKHPRPGEATVHAGGAPHGGA